MKLRFGISCILLLAAVLSTGPARAEDPSETDARMPRLKMEELEVRGKRGRPDVLYFPAPDEIYLLSPVRFDLIREALIRPLDEGISP